MVAGSCREGSPVSVVASRGRPTQSSTEKNSGSRRHYYHGQSEDGTSSSMWLNYYIYLLKWAFFLNWLLLSGKSELTTFVANFKITSPPGAELVSTLLCSKLRQAMIILTRPPIQDYTRNGTPKAELTVGTWGHTSTRMPSLSRGL